MIADILQRFWNDGKVDVLVVLVVLDFLLGVLSALRSGTFRLSYIADFMRKDVLFKIGTYLLLYAGAIYAGEADIILDGIDVGLIAGAAYAVIVAALVGSILNSLRELGAVPGIAAASKGDRNPVDMLTADEDV